MTATVNFNGHFSNQSLQGESPRGNVGKLTPDQIKLRARKHAMRLANGKPTYAEIAESWMKEFQISMSGYAEREWASRHEEDIQQATIELVEAGIIKFAPFTENSLLNTLKVSGQDTGKLVRKLEAEITDLLGSIDMTFDPLAKIPITDKEYADAEPVLQAVYDKIIRKEQNRHKLRMMALEQFAVILKDQKKILLETVNVANDLYQSSESRMKQMQKQVTHQVAEILTDKDKTEFDPDSEITDADREKVLNRSNGDPE